MPDLADLLAAPDSVRRGPSCQTGIALVALSDDDRTLVFARMADPAFTDKQVSEALTAVTGVDVSRTSVARHRGHLVGKADVCKCPADLKPSGD